MRSSLSVTTYLPCSDTCSECDETTPSTFGVCRRRLIAALARRYHSPLEAIPPCAGLRRVRRELENPGDRVDFTTRHTERFVVAPNRVGIGCF